MTVTKGGRFKRISATAAATALTGASLIAFAPANPASATNLTFQYTGASQSWSVPAGVTKIYATLQGAQGNGVGGGQGAIVGGTYAIPSGTTSLTVNVGGQTGWLSSKTGGNGGGASLRGTNGGQGGDQTDIRFSSATSDIIAVAGGGGGGGGKSRANAGGDGGAADVNAGAGAVGGGNRGGAGGAGGAAGNVADSVGGGANSGSGSGGGGGGGAGATDGKGGGGGKGGVTDPFTSFGGGGGGAGSSSGGSGENVVITSGGTGAGSVLIQSIDILTKTGGDIRVGNPVSEQLEADGGTSPYTWTATGLPPGITLSSSGVVGGAADTVGNYAVGVQVSDVHGATTVATIPVDVVPSNTKVLDGAASDITMTTATGNGSVATDAVPAGAVFCKIASSAAGVQTGTFFPASPATVTANNPGQAVTCAFTGLLPGNTYFYGVFADIGSETFDGGNPQSFTTAGKPPHPPNPPGPPVPGLPQTANIKPPHHIKAKGTTVLLKKKTKTNAGNKVCVKVKTLLTRGDQAAYRLIRGPGCKLSIQTYGVKFNVTVTYKAKASPGYQPFREAFLYKVGKKSG